MKNKQRGSYYKWLLVILMFYIYPAFADNFTGVHLQKISINVRNGTFEEVAKDIESQTLYRFFYESNEVKSDKTYNVNINSDDINEVMQTISKQGNFSYTIDKNQIHIVLDSKSNSNIQQSNRVIVKGRVTDAAGEPLIGVSILVLSSKIGTITDLNGNFSIEANRGDKIRITYIGYKEVLIDSASDKFYNIKLNEVAEALDEIVVTALGLKKSEKALGYAVQKVEGETLTTVKGASIGTSLTGKIAGVNVQNSTEFNTDPSILIRGKSPLIVIDGIPVSSGLKDVIPDDIEDITILKGPGASALYGARGGNGAIMVTTKRGNKEGLSINFNSNTMFNAGHLRIPKPQHSYSTGNNGKYDRNDFVWGDKLDIGREAVQYNPETYEWEMQPLVSKGRNNFKNFLQQALVTNNTLDLSYKGEKGSFRTSLNHIYNRGQYPNLQSNKFNYALAGGFDINNIKVDASLKLTHEYTPQNRGAGYGATGYVYNLLVWTGTDFDIRDYRNYWKKGREQQEQNWWNPGWYDNPYFLAYERTHSNLRSAANGHFSITYSPTPWLKTMARLGYEFYSNKNEYKTPMDTRGNKKGAFSVNQNRGYTINSDFMAIAEYKFGDFAIDGLLGTGTYFYENHGLSASTANGLSIPGFYSLNASVDPITGSSSENRRQLNSVYGKVGASWRSTAFIELTGRNDWVSSQPSSERSYFYPSVSSSFILSELVNLPDFLTFMKFRGSWSLTKTPASNYIINTVYSISKNLWDNKNGATYPTTLRDKDLKPIAKSSWEIGTDVYFLDNRIRLDLAYYQERLYNLQRSAALSEASGFSSILVNYGEEQQRKGIEITIAGDIIKNKNFKWTSVLNWAADRYYYYRVDAEHSTDRPWVAAGKRWDWMSGVYDWQRDSEGNIIHLNGKPQLMKYDRGGFNENPDWIWGFSNIFNIKDFTVGISFDGRVGGYGYNQTSQAMWNSGTHPDSDNEWRYDEVVNGKKNYIGKGVKVVSGSVKYDKYGRITEDTREFAPNDVPISYQEYVQSYHSWSGDKKIQNIKKMTFFKLRELSIGYTFPKELVKKMSLNKLSLSLVGQNLFIWSPNFKYSDPDVHGDSLNSPSVRYVGFNLQLGF